MKKTIIVIAVVAVVGIGIYYYFSSGGSYNNTQNVPAPSASTPASGELTALISIKNFSFNPASLAVKTGTTVTWTNNDSVAHTVTSDADNIFSSATLSPGQSFSFTFSEPGSITYHCNIHRTMTGTIIVSN